MKGSKLTYGDSVAYYTPIYVKFNNEVIIITIEDLSKRFSNLKWQSCTTPGKEKKEYFELTDLDIQTWTENGWTKLYRIIRHKLIPSKKIYSIICPLGIVDVTDDHSLLNINGTSISPKEILDSIDKKIQIELLNKFMSEEISNKDEYKDKYKDDDSFENQIEPAIIYHDLYKKNEINIKYENDDFYYKVKKYDNQENNEIKVIDITEKYGNNQYVYDLTAENHHFAAGIGNLIVHNTDSIFKTLQMKLNSEIK